MESPIRLDDLSNSDLKQLVVELLGRVSALEATVSQQRAEIARLKGLPPRPQIKPSGMDKATERRPGKDGGSKAKRPRGSKREQLVVTEEQLLKAVVPAGSRFKGYEDVVVQDLFLAPRVIRYRRERWRTASGETIVAPLPDGVIGGFGPGLHRFILAVEEDSDGDYIDYHKLIRDHQATAAIILDLKERDDRVAELTEANIPLVVLGEYTPRTDKLRIFLPELVIRASA